MLLKSDFINFQTNFSALTKPRKSKKATAALKRQLQRSQATNAALRKLIKTQSKLDEAKEQVRMNSDLKKFQNQSCKDIFFIKKLKIFTR